MTSALSLSVALVTLVLLLLVGFALGPVVLVFLLILACVAPFLLLWGAFTRFGKR